MNKNRFLTFCLSFIPGCGLMYLGYMKKGLQMMLVFAASGFLAYFFAGSFQFEWIMTFFIVLLPVIWFYQLFDSMHSISRMKRLEMDTPTDDGFFVPEKLYKFSPLQNPTVSKVIAFVLIFIGGTGILFGVLDNLYYVLDYQIADRMISIIRNTVTPALVSVVLIAVGIKLLRGNKPKEESDTDDVEKEETQS